MQQQFLRDLSGGLSAAVIALPLALGFGVISFAPLGDPGAGALAGLYGAIFTGFFASLLGGTPSQVTGPTGPMTVVTTSVVAAVMKYEASHGHPEIDTVRVLTLVFVCGMMGGFIQIALGLMRAGRLIKFIPYPVIAGFMNGIAVIIFLGQLKPFLGISGKEALMDFAVRPAIVGTAIATVALIVLSGRLAPKLPAGLVGLAGGTAVFFGLGALLDPALLVFEGNKFIVGEIPRAIPLPHYAWDAVLTVTSFDLAELEMLVPPALALGVLGAIDSLLTSLVADVATRSRHDSDRELVGQGIGNVIAGAFGGLSGAGATVRTLVNIENGGRTRLSGMVHSLALLAVVLVLGPMAGWIPMGVLAGILVVTSVRMVDQWSVQLLRKRSAWADSLVVVTVTVVTVAVDLMVAVGIGVLISLVLFVGEIVSHKVARRAYRCTEHRSKRVRSDESEAILAQHGAQILVYELEGSLFFGTTDTFAKEVETAIEEPTSYLILDLKRVTTIDITGAELIKRMVDQAVDREITVFLSGLLPFGAKRQALVAYLGDLQVISTVGADHVFTTLDDAVEAAENVILTEVREDTGAFSRKEPVRRCALFADLTDEEYALVAPDLEPVTFKKGETLWKRGDASTHLVIVRTGHLGIHLDGPTGRIRLASFGPSHHVGEMAFLQGRSRSGTLVADVDTEGVRWNQDRFLVLRDTHAEVAVKLLCALSLRLSERLRVTSAELAALEA